MLLIRFINYILNLCFVVVFIDTDEDWLSEKTGEVEERRLLLIFL